MIGETEEFWPVLRGLFERPRVRGSVIHDARVAAICLAQGVEALLTRDRDFSCSPTLGIVPRGYFITQAGRSFGAALNDG